MGLRFESESQFEAFLKLSLDEEAAKSTVQGVQNVGRTINEVTVEQFKAGMASAVLYEKTLADVEKRTASLQREWWRAQRVLRATSFIFQQIAIAGTAMWAPLVANAIKYNKEMEKLGGVADPLVTSWQKQTKALQAAQMSIGRTTTQVLLPYLEKVAKIADKAAGIVEEHPGIIEAALKTGIAVTTVGVLGALVANGVKMIVDVRFVAASASLELSSWRMLRSAEIYAAASAKNLPGGAGVLARAGGSSGGVAGIAAAGVASVGLGYAAAQTIRNSPFEQFLTLVRTLASIIPAFGAGMHLENFVYKFTHVEEEFTKLAGILDKVSPALGNIVRAYADFIGVGEKTESTISKGTSALIHFGDAMERLKKEQDAAIVILELQRNLVRMASNYERDRLDIIDDGNKQALAIQRRYANSVRDAFNAMVRNIDRLTADFILDNERAEEDHLQERSEIVSEGHDDLIQMENDFQERLLQLRLDHEDNVDALERERDALGLVKEQRRYDRERDELLREQNDRIAQIRSDIAERLRETDRQYLIERQRRQEDYLIRVQEERDRYEEAKKDAAERRAEEKAALKEAQAEKLQALREGYEKEKSDAVNAAYEKIVLLQGALNAELRMNQYYHGLILQETRDFLEDYLDILNMERSDIEGTTTGTTNMGNITGSTGTHITTHKQQGGPIPFTGMYKLHKGEEVLSPSTVRAAEQAIGGSFSQATMLATLAGRASRVYYYDNRRIDAALSARQRDEIANDIIERLVGVI